MPHGVFLRNIQRSTQWLTRRRLRSGRRHFQRTGIVRPLAGPRRDFKKEVHPLVRLWSLSWPGLLVVFFGAATNLAYGLHALLFFGLSFIFTARAATARTRPWVRITATIICLGYPILVLLSKAGVLG